jgi:hypothetical protein
MARMRRQTKLLLIAVAAVAAFWFAKKKGLLGKTTTPIM